MCSLNGFFLFTGYDHQGNNIVTSDCIVPPFRINSGYFERDKRFYYEELFINLDTNKRKIIDCQLNNDKYILQELYIDCRVKQKIADKKQVKVEKHNKGGQSRERFARINQEKIDKNREIQVEVIFEMYKNHSDIIIIVDDQK